MGELVHVLRFVFKSVYGAGGRERSAGVNGARLVARSGESWSPSDWLC